MAKTFTYIIKQDPQQIIDKVTRIASEKGIEVAGDLQQGRLAGHGVNAEYQLESSALTITVNKKPLIVSWSMVEKMLSQFVDDDNSTYIA